MSNRTSLHFTRGSIAETYQRFFEPLIPAPLARELVERASPQAGECIADVACGTGVVTRLAAEHVGAIEAPTALTRTNEIAWLQSTAQIRRAELSKDTQTRESAAAGCAVPLTWHSEMDPARPRSFRVALSDPGRH